MKISILILTHNAPRFVYKTIKSLQATSKEGFDYEVIVVDNKSKWITRQLLKLLKYSKSIDKLKYNEKNEWFAKGNNVASTLTDNETTHYLLLNSDVKINSKEWLKKMCDIFPISGGIVALGAVTSEPVRADGYCLMINKWLYDKYKLDEEFEWWWSVTKLESQVLHEGLPIYAVENHENLLHHYGGKSGKGFSDAKGMDIKIEEVKKWFNEQNSEVKIIENLL